MAKFLFISWIGRVNKREPGKCQSFRAERLKIKKELQEVMGIFLHSVPEIFYAGISLGPVICAGGGWSFVLRRCRCFPPPATDL
jgi:hypothetical protein